MTFFINILAYTYKYWSLKDVSNCQCHASQTEIHEHLYQETDHNVTELGPKKIRQTPIRDNPVDSTEKSTTDIDICFPLKNQPNKFGFKALFLKFKICTRSETECHRKAGWR